MSSIGPTFCRRSLGRALLAVLVGVAVLRSGTAAADDPKLLALTPPPDAGEAIAPKTFVLALSIQLEPYRVRLTARAWRPPTRHAAQARRAREIAHAAGARFVAWYEVELPPPGTEAPPKVLVMLSGAGGGTTRTIALGRVTPGIERSMAVALRTLVGAQLERKPAREEERSPAAPATAPAAMPAPSTQPADQPATQPSPRPGDRSLATAAVAGTEAGAEVEARTPEVEDRTPPQAAVSGIARGGRRQDRVHLQASYTLSLFPVGAEVRHGPTAIVGARLWRGLEARIAAGYRLAGGGVARGASWSQSAVDLRGGVRYGWRMRPRWSVLAGGELRVTRVAVSARMPGLGTVEESALWELGLGALGGGALWLRPHLALELRLLVGWMPVGHHVWVRGVDVSNPAGLEVSVSSGLRVTLW